VLGAAARRVVEHHRRRVGAAPGPVVARDRPGEALLGLAAPGSSTGMVVSSANSRGEASRISCMRRTTGTISRPPCRSSRRGLAVDLDPLPGQDLRLAVQGQVVA
jgi:hypothetical protein